MVMNRHTKPARWWRNEHDLFVVSLLLKAADGALEIVGGLLAFVISPQMLNTLGAMLVRRELAEDPNDFIARTLMDMVHQYVPSVQVFIGVYLLAHGIIKVFLVYNLLKSRMWSYPVAIGIFSLFTIYQIYLYINAPNVALILLIILDIIVVVLTALEYKHVAEGLRKKDKSGPLQ